MNKYTGIGGGGEIDGVLMVPVSQPVPPLRALVDSLQVPGLFFSRPYATHAWSSIAELRKSGRKLDVIATSSYGDLDPYMRMFRTVHHMRKSKVLVGAATPAGRQQAADAFSKHFGTAFKFITGPEFRNAFDAVSEREAQKQADEFDRGALRVVEPRPKEIRDGVTASARWPRTHCRDIRASRGPSSTMQDSTACAKATSLQ